MHLNVMSYTSFESNDIIVIYIIASIVSLIISALLALIPANIAKKKGYSFGVWWLYGWFLFIVALIHVQFVEDKNAPKMPYPNGYIPYVPVEAKSESESVADELSKYKKLFDQGVLTEEEFNAKKEQLLKLI